MADDAKGVASLKLLFDAITDGSEDPAWYQAKAVTVWSMLKASTDSISIPNDPVLLRRWLNSLS